MGRAGMVLPSAFTGACRIWKEKGTAEEGRKKCAEGGTGESGGRSW